MAALSLTLALAAILQAAASPDQLARDAFQAWANQDGQALQSLWVKDATELPQFQRRTEGLWRARCYALLGATVRRVTADDDRTEVEAVVAFEVTSRLPGSPASLEIDRVILTAVRDGSGWKLTRWRSAVDMLAGEVVAATDAQRPALVDAHPELQTRALVRALNQEALSFVNQRKYDEAMSLIRLVQRIAKELDDVGGLASSLGLESIILRRRAQPDMAASLELSRRSVALAEESGEPEVIATALLRMARTLQLEDPVEARQMYDRVVALGPYLADQTVVARAATFISDYYHERGDYRSARRYAELCRSIAEATGDSLTYFSSEILLGQIYFDENDLDLAVLHLKRGMEKSREANFRDGTIECLVKLAACYRRMHRRAEYLRTIAEALALGTEAKAPESFFADLLAERGTYFLEADDLARAEKDFTEALDFARRGGQSDQASKPGQGLAEIRLRQKRYDEAIRLAEEAAAVLAEGVRFDRFAPLVIAAKAHRALGRRDLAYAELREAVRMTEEQREVVGGGDRQRRSFFESRVPAYLALLDMLLEDHATEDAFAIAEEAKGRTLLDILGGGRILMESMVGTDDRRRESELQSRVTSLNARSRTRDGEEALRQARAELESFRATLYTRYPRLGAQRRTPAPLTSSELLRMLPDERTAFVEYVVERDAVRIFVVRKRKGRAVIRVRTVALGGERLTRRVDRYVRLVSQRYHGYRGEARALYDLLLQPVAPLLRGARAVGLVPDGPLWHLPFESLIARDGKAVAESVATFYAPSITVYREMTRTAAPAPASFLAFADPGHSMPEAESEAKQIARLFPPRRTRVYTGGEALESRARSESAGYAVIHFATHGVLDDGNPMYSHLVLARSTAEPAGDGLLETWEMMQLDLHATLVVLSACDTGRGVVHEGEGLIGMSWALFVAGCPSTIATEWQVGSGTTATLMTDFYRHWVPAASTTPFAKAEALRRARLDVMRDGHHEHPYYWAPFVLLGSGQ